MSARWSEIPFDLFELIANLSPISDLGRIGVVCKSWRSLLDKTQIWFRYRHQIEALRIASPFHMIPKLMLKSKNDPDDTCHFIDIATGRTFQLPLPETKTTLIHGSGDGWILTEKLDNNGTNKKMIITLLNPITLQQIRLPPLNPIAVHDVWLHPGPDRLEICKALTVQCPDYLIVVIMYLSGCRNQLAVFRPGLDEQWGLIEYFFTLQDIAYHNGLFYAFLHKEIYVWDAYGIIKGTPLRRIKFDYYPKLSIGSYRQYSTVVFGEIFLVSRDRYCDMVIVFKEDRENRRWVEVKDLGDCSLFFSDDDLSSIVVCPVPSGFRKNCIYFTEKFGRKDVSKGHGIGIYSFDDGKYSNFYPEKFCPESLKTFLSPIWVAFNPQVRAVNN